MSGPVMGIVKFIIKMKYKPAENLLLILNSFFSLTIDSFYPAGYRMRIKTNIMLYDKNNQLIMDSTP